MERGNYFTARPFADPSQRTFEEDLANIVDMGVGAAAKARPYLKKFVQNLGEGQRSMLGSVMNQLPTSANLLGRYYTGLKDENLEFSDRYKQGLGAMVKQADELTGTQRLRLRQDEQDAAFAIKDAEKNLAKLKAGEQLPMFFGRPLTEADMRYQREMNNHRLAHVRSMLRKMDEGKIIFATQAGTDKGNPLESTGTSLGSAYFTKNPDGTYSTTEDYDFMYANADQKRKPIQGPVDAKSEYKNPDRPSLGMVRQAVETFLGRREDDVPGYSMKDIAGAAAVTDVGRSLVSRFEDDPFTYTLTVPGK
jgi:hypothetical protein